MSKPYHAYHDCISNIRPPHRHKKSFQGSIVGYRCCISTRHKLKARQDNASRRCRKMSRQTWVFDVVLEELAQGVVALQQCTPARCLQSHSSLSCKRLRQRLQACAQLPHNLHQVVESVLAAVKLCLSNVEPSLQHMYQLYISTNTHMSDAICTCCKPLPQCRSHARACCSMCISLNTSFITHLSRAN